MSLYRKTIIVVGITFACLIILLYATSKIMLLRSFTELEKQDVTLNVQRVQSAITDVLAKLDSESGDWAGWNDTCTFIEDVNDNYIKVNLPDASYVILGINMTLFIDPSGKIVYGKNLDLTSREEISLPGNIERYLAGNIKLWNHTDPFDSVSGIVLFPEGPMLVASRPIITSEGKGPVRGALIMGRYLDTEEIRRLSEITHISLTVERLDDPQRSPDFLNAQANLNDLSPVFVQPANEDFVAGYSLLKDINENPILVLKVDLPRNIYQQGRDAMRYFLLALLVFSAVFGVVVLLLLERVVLRRLSRLNTSFGAISSSSDHAMRLPVTGHDELAQLATSANRMLESLELTHRKLSDNEERYRTLTENAYDLISEISTQGQYLYISPNYRDVLGYEPRDLINKSISDIIHTEDLNDVLNRLKKLEFSTLKHLTCRMISKNSEIRWFESTGRAYQTAAGETRIVFVSRDITERQKYEETIWRQAFHDTLTGLPNRMLFIDRLSLALAHTKRSKQMLAVIFLDLDRFKLINDTLGHEIGDQLLKSVALRLQECVREGDTIARLGGDEFTLLLPEIIKSEGAAKIAQKIIEEILQPFHIGDHELYISTSIGIALYPSDGEDADTLLKNADTAMYLAKERGRNNYQFYTPALNKKTIERMTMENELRRAIERKEFVLHYQPKVNIKTSKIIGMEALVRWQHPVRGLIPPADFIPIAEETGMIVPLGEWVLRTACAQNKAWQDAGFEPLSISVNLSGRQFQLQNLAVVIKRILKETDLAPYWLELEITESTAMQNADYTIETLNKLKEMGVQFSIDDFGTGYSSLSQLKRFPVDKLKIDKSFVVEIGKGHDSEIIASTVIVLGKSLKLGVIAEGVETEEQLNFLKKYQCNEMQGFLFSKPVTADEFSALLKQKS